MLHVSFVQTDTNKVGCCCVHVGDGVEMDTTTPNPGGGGGTAL